MQKTRKLIALLLAVMMVLSMCTVGMMSVSALPEGAIVNDAEGNDASSIDGELYGLMGDSDSNGKVNVKDATQIQKAAAKILTLDETAEALADVDQNGKVNVKDATAIQKWAAKIKVDMPINCLVYYPKVETTPAATTAPAPTVVIPTTTTADETEPATTKATIPVIVIPTTVATEPTEAPATTVEPTEAPATTVEPTEAPATTVKPTEAPVTTVKPTEAPVTTAKPTEAPVTTVKPTQATTVATVPTTTVPATQGTTADDGMITVYFAKPANWADACIYGFYGVEGEVADVEWPAGYPGLPMTFVETDENGVDIYTYDAPETINYIKFTDGTNTSPNRRTTNVPSSEIFDGACYTAGAETTKPNQFNYITYNYTPDQQTTTSAQVATTTGEDNTTSADDGMITVYFTNAEKWPVVKIHAWTDNGDVTKYPGVEMNKVKTNSNGQDVYSYDVPANVTGVMFTGYTTDDHSDYSLKTVSIKGADFKGDGYGYYCKSQQSDKRWLVQFYKWEGTTVNTTASTAVATTVADNTTKADDTTSADGGKITVYFTNAEKWPVVKIHAWTADGDVTEYPGVEMNKVKTNSNGQDVYSYDVPANVTGVMFTGYTTDDHSDYSLKTVSIKGADFKGDGYGYYCKTQQSDKRWLVESYKWEGTTVTTTASTAATTVADDTTKADDTTVATQPTTTDATDPTESKPVLVEADVVLTANFNNWIGQKFYKTTDDNIVTLTLDLEAGTYKFKLVRDGAYFGNSHGGESASFTDECENWGFRVKEKNDPDTTAQNCVFIATGGTYTFTVNLAEYTNDPAILRLTVVKSGATESTTATETESTAAETESTAAETEATAPDGEKDVITFKDGTSGSWIKGDDANIYVYDYATKTLYLATKVNDTTWTAEVPKGLTTIHFYRVDPDITCDPDAGKNVGYWNAWTTNVPERDPATQHTYTADGSTSGKWNGDNSVKFYVMGSFNGWSAGTAMTAHADGSYTQEIQLAAGTHQYKIATSDWSTEYPSGYDNNATVTVSTAGIYVFKLTAGGQISATPK